MRKKKKGSSLITVVIIFSILITVGTAMLSMTVGDYKMRVKESKNIENLYGSESGLDVAYDITVKTFEAAVQYGNKEVQALKSKDGNPDSPNDAKYKDYQEQIYYWKHYNDGKDETHKKGRKEIKEEIEKIKKNIEILINEEFRRTFKNFIYVNKDNLENSNEYKPNKLKESIEKGIYVDSVNGIKKEDLSYKEVELNSQENKPELVVDEISDPENKEENEKKQEVYTLKITSTFETQKGNVDVIGTNMRKIQTTYNMVVPNYKDVAFSESVSEVENNTPLNNKAIIIEKDMKIEGNSKLNLDGDIFVWGEDNKTDNKYSNKVYDKYKGGINLENCTANFNGEVVTGRTFNIGSNAHSTVSGNLYAMNVYAGKPNGDMAENSNLTVKSPELDKEKKTNLNKESKDDGQVVIDNDITLKAKNTQITIENFYGINDKNTKYGDTLHGSQNGTKERTSSSIIVNGDEKSNVIINKKAYIMGVANINTTPEYQTGESTGVKGNYIAYGEALDYNDKFDYYNPLQLLDEENILKKSKRFVDYWKGKLEEKNTGGIQLPEQTYSVGAIVYKDKSGNIQLKDSSYNLDKNNIDDINTVIPKKQIEYASKVYAIGKNVGSNWYDTLGKLSSPIGYFMKLENIPVDYDLDSQELNNEKAIFNKDNNKTIIIKGKNASEAYDNNSGESTEKEIVIDATNGDVNAIIATKGDVIIDGKVDFNGSIIAEGNLKIQGNQEKNIKYDKDLCDRIKASNVELFDSVFIDSIYNEKSSENGGSANSNFNDKNLDVQYDLNKFLKTKLWKIIK
ncbi:hypothetical protein UT300005_15900 [Clostridium sp. CTA-5]